jgi:hypothetical protein
MGHNIQGMAASKHHSLMTLENHLRECLTGYQSGTADSPLAGEPRREYDPSLNKLTRYENKAREMGINRRTLERYLASYRTDGLFGLIDLRQERHSTKLGRVDPAWELILHEQSRNRGDR